MGSVYRDVLQQELKGFREMSNQSPRLGVNLRLTPTSVLVEFTGLYTRHN